MSMCNAYKSPRAVGLIVVFLAIALVPAAARTTTVAAPERSAMQASAGTHEDMICATGEGAVAAAAEEPNRARAYLEAKGCAKMQAVANLIQSVYGTTVRYHSEGNGYSSEEKLTQEAEGVIENVRIVSERRKQEGKDTIVEVTVGVPAAGLLRNADRGLAAAAAGTQVALSDLDLSWIKLPNPPAAAPESVLRRAKDTDYTSVIIDTTGLGVLRSMSPKILRPDGSEVWGTVKANYDFVSDYGIAAYARSLGEAYANARAGDNPLVIRAIARGRSAYGSDAVISSDDADYLLAQNRAGRFLESFRVLFVVDPVLSAPVSRQMSQ